MIALLDANILYPAPLRDLFLQMAVTGLFQAKWTEEIHREWIEALVRNEPGRNRASLERTRDLMNRSTRDCLVTGWERLVPRLDLPDAHDRHVLAAAVAGHCDIIVTQNLKHFPGAALAPHGIKACHPDAFTANLLQQTPRMVCLAVRKVRARLKNPPYTVGEYLDTLARQNMIESAAALGELADSL